MYMFIEITKGYSHSAKTCMPLCLCSLINSLGLGVLVSFAYQRRAKISIIATCGVGKKEIAFILYYTIPCVRDIPTPTHVEASCHSDRRRAWYDPPPPDRLPLRPPRPVNA